MPAPFLTKAGAARAKVIEKEKERKKEEMGEWGGEREYVGSANVCVCVRVCVCGGVPVYISVCVCVCVSIRGGWGGRGGLCI